jgi:hypothetical protein
MRLSITVALILAVVGEMLAGRDGVGHWILLSARSFRAPDLYAGVIVLGALGYASALLLALVERQALGWRARAVNSTAPRGRVWEPGRFFAEWHRLTMSKGAGLAGAGALAGLEKRVAPGLSGATTVHSVLPDERVARMDASAPRRPHDPLHLDTRLVHGGTDRSGFGETSEALFLTQGFIYESAESAEARFLNEEPGYSYTRFSNPTTAMFEERMALLEGAETARATATGMAAVTAP